MEETKELNHVIIGGLWWDKVNGNTYNNAKIITFVGVSYEVHYTGFSYGYGRQYYYEAKQLIEELYKDYNNNIVDGGAFYMTKKEAKNGQF